MPYSFKLDLNSELDTQKLAVFLGKNITQGVVYLIGDLDMDLVANIIFKYFKNPIVKTKSDISLYVENK